MINSVCDSLGSQTSMLDKHLNAIARSVAVDVPCKAYSNAETVDLKAAEFMPTRSAGQWIDQSHAQSQLVCRSGGRDENVTDQVDSAPACVDRVPVRTIPSSSGRNAVAQASRWPRNSLRKASMSKCCPNPNAGKYADRDVQRTQQQRSSKRERPWCLSQSMLTAVTE